MKVSFSICCFILTVQSLCLAQPGPEVFFYEKINSLNDSLTLNPENDESRLQRIHLFYQEDRSMTEYDINHLFRKFEAGTLTIPMDYASFYALYGNCYQYSNPKLALSYYRKTADLRPSEDVYTDLFNGYYKLRNVDTALLYYDTLITRYGFQFQKFDSDHLTFRKIDLMGDPNAYNPKLVQFYTHLSQRYFNEYRERSSQEKFELNYENQSLLETGFNYQFDLCDYYLRWQKRNQAKNVLENLKEYIGKNVHGFPVEIYKYHRYYFLSGNILEQEGQSKEAIKRFLYAVDYVHYKDTVWSTSLLQKYPKNPDALVLHAQTLYNKQLSDNWQAKDPNARVLALFQQAKKMGSTHYRIFLAQSDHFLFLKDYKKALDEIDQAIRFSPHQPIAYEKKAGLLREAYWSHYLSEKELEEQNQKLQEQMKPLYENAVTSVPEI